MAKEDAMASLWGDTKRVVDDDNNATSDIRFDRSLADEEADEQDFEDDKDSDDDKEEPVKGKKEKKETNDEPDFSDENDTDEDEDTDEEDTDEEADEDSDDISAVNTFALELVDKGVISEDLDFSKYDDSVEGLVEMVRDSQKSALEQEIPEDWRPLVTAMKQGIPVHEFLARMDATPYEDADVEDPDTQEFIIREALKIKGESDDKIEKKIERYKKLDIMKDEAEENLDFVVNHRDKERESYAKELKQREAQAADAQRRFVEDTRKKITEAKEIAGFDVSDVKLKKKLDDYMFKPVGKNGETQYTIDRNTNLVESAFLTMMRPDMGKIEKVAKSKATRQLEKKLENYTDSNMRTGGKSNVAKKGKNDNGLSSFWGQSASERIIED